MAFRNYLFLLLLFFLPVASSGQMVVGSDTLIGNEWITYDRPYYKFSVEADGIYRLPYEVLQAAGLGPGVSGDDLRLYSLGIQIPIYVTTTGAMGPGDYLEFYGLKNRSELDRFLFLAPDSNMLNPSYSMYTDKRPYYLVVDPDQPAERVNILHNDLSALPAPVTHYRHTEIRLFTNVHNDPYEPVTGGGAVTYSSYIHGEGFAGPSAPNSVNTIDAPGLAPVDDDAVLRIRMVSTNNGNHQFIIIFNGVPLDTISMVKQVIRDLSYNIPQSMLAASNEVRITTILAPSRHAIVEINLTYSRTTDFAGGKSAYIRSVGTEDNYFVLDQFQHLQASPVIYTTDGKWRMEAEINPDDKVHFRWPSSHSGQSFYIAGAENAITTINVVEQIKFTDLSGDDTEYIIISHPALMEPGTSSDYVQYRSSPQGGSYRAKAYSILDLYEQFGYGVEKHPMSIRNFVTFIERFWPSAKMIFIVGRGIEYHRSRISDGNWDPFFFVPTYGKPGSDNLLASTLWDLVPRYPIGRIAVIDRANIELYLNKVREHDQAASIGNQTLEDKKWLRNVMHITGGQNAVEQSGFRNTMNNLANELANSYYSADFTYFEKTSTDIIGESQTKQMEKLLAEGVPLINYLGHSSTNTFEFAIVDPAQWNNKGKYPVFSAMGCDAGQIHGPNYSLSDKFVFVPDVGAIAFISGSGKQFPAALISWARPWYRYMGNEGYGEPLGESIRYALQTIGKQVNPESSALNTLRYLLEQQTFQGDPAIRMYPLPGPDYIIDNKSVSWAPTLPTTRTDSLDLRFTILNIGKNIHHELAYTVSMESPDGEIHLLASSAVQMSTFDQDISIRIPFVKKPVPGLYTLHLQLDPEDKIEELPHPEAKLNNHLRDNLGKTGIALYVADNVFTSVWPPDFAIVQSSKPTLIASGSNAFLPSQQIVFQLDTHALFNSPFLITEQITGQSATIEWQPPVDLEPGREYFWRVSIDSSGSNQAYSWSRRSFIYLPDSPDGWNQSHFHQLTDNPVVQLAADSSKYTFDFNQKAINFRMINRFHNHALGLIPYFFKDGDFDPYLAQRFRDDKVHAFVVAIDSVTGAYIMNTAEGLYGSTPDIHPMGGFAYDLTSPEKRQAMLDFIENVIPSGYYVFFYTYPHVDYEDFMPETWAADEEIYGRSIFSVIEKEAPTSMIRLLEDRGSVPYILLFQKDRGLIEEQIAATVDDVIAVSFDVGSSFSSGDMTSVLIGPAQQWGAIQQLVTTYHDTSGITRVSAWALDNSLQDTLWISEDISEPVLDISFIDPKNYPYIQLALHTTDSVEFHPSSIDYWRVLYDGSTELVLRPEYGFNYNNDTLNQGQQFSLEVAVENISPWPVDSVDVSLTMTGSANEVIELTTILPRIAGNDFALARFEAPTATLDGDYQVIVNVNPSRTIRETTYANNIGILALHVGIDRINPVLDVTFDGYHLQDEDLVSARPVIMISLVDDYEFLRLSDTTVFDIYLQYPSATSPKRISFGESWMHFQPAPESGKNVAIVEMTPYLHEEGLYYMRVSARDASGNPSGLNDYQITFRVVHTGAISRIYAAPNPFSSTTSFVYTLTGEGPPADYTLRIADMAGRTVREISSEEIGPLTVGTHYMTFQWDGSDQNGVILPSGMYLYTLIARDGDGRPYKILPTKADAWVSGEGWGKVVIVR